MIRPNITTKRSVAGLLIAILFFLLCLSIGAETDATVMAYQVTEETDGVFSLRVIAGVNSLNYERFGYDITLTAKDATGNEITETLEGETSIVYSSLYGGGTYHSVKDTFGYEYAALATVKNLSIHSAYTKIEVRTYVVLGDGRTKDGVGATLLYKGSCNEDGYPILSIPPIRDNVIDGGSCGAEGDNLTWELTDEDALIIRGTGDMEDYASFAETPWSFYSASIRKITVEDGVTGIGDYAFFGCTNLTSVTLPASITREGTCAFYSASTLGVVAAEENVSSIDWSEFLKQ